MGLFVAVVALALHASAAPSMSESGLALHVRVEGRNSHIWDGFVFLEGPVNVTATGGTNYSLEPTTPLAALVAASRSGGFRLGVSDWNVDLDFTVAKVGEEYWDDGSHWWEYRVNYVATYYGVHKQWIRYGPPLQDGDEVLWYVDDFDMVHPLRLGFPDQPPSKPGLGRLAFVEAAFPDLQHRAGASWPEQTWRAASQGTLNVSGSSYGFTAGFAFVSSADQCEDAVAESAGHVRSRLVMVPCE